MKKYIHRTIESGVLTTAKQFPVLAVTGPRQTGKSTMLKQLFANYNYITFDEMTVRATAKNDPALFIDTLKTPVIIDEIQYVPEILPYIKINVDSKRENGKFILTGSQMFTLMAGISESLAGRIALFELLPFSYDEIGQKPHTPLACYKQILKGFYPLPNTQETNLNVFYGSYLSTYIERDIRQIANIQDISVFQNFMQLLAARAGNLLNIHEVAKESGIAHATAKRWLSMLESSRIIYLLKPYFKNITKRIVKSPKIYFTDTGLLAYLLKYSNAETLMAGAMSGAIFENMIFVEILKQKFNNNENFDLFFYRDSNGVEADFVIDKGQELLLLEIKSGKNVKPDTAKNLISIPIKPAKKLILSFNDKQLQLNKEVKAIPWQDFSAVDG